MRHFILFFARGRPPQGIYVCRKVSAKLDLNYQKCPHSSLKRNFISISKNRIKIKYKKKLHNSSLWCNHNVLKRFYFQDSLSLINTGRTYVYRCSVSSCSWAPTVAVWHAHQSPWFLCNTWKCTCTWQLRLTKETRLIIVHRHE